LSDQRLQPASIEDVLSSCNVGVLIVDACGRVAFMNQALCRELSLEGDAHGRTQAEVFAALDPKVREQLESNARHLDLSGDGRARWLERNAWTIEAGAFAGGRLELYYDVTDWKRAEDRLVEKETLLREVHHRVKNNLQIVSSLLNLQARHFFDDRDRALVRESQHRIRSMALVHEMLYATAGAALIDFSEYVHSLSHSLRAAFGETARDVVFSIRADGLVLDLDTAVHMGMLLNELISNALKHAFRDKGGALEVEIREDERGLHLMVRDDGVGLPPGFDLESAPTLGVQLVRAVSSQLGASVELESSGGTVARISVPRQGGKWVNRTS
jgi:two-component sensor histidine kinase